MRRLILKRFSKRTLFALLLCLVVLLGSLGAYAYLTYNQSGTSEEAIEEPDFTFTWGPDHQRIVNGTFRMEIWLTLDGENLTMTIKANDDDYSGSDYLGLVFFNTSDPNEYLPNYQCYILYADNLTMFPSVLTPSGIIGVPMYPEERGPQNVTFDPETGYTFVVKFPWIDREGTEWNPCQMLRRVYDWPNWNIMQVCYNDEQGDVVFARFTFEV